MIYLTLFLEFLKIGTFAFGGGYGTIPLVRDCVLSHGWMDEAMLANIIAISESTPGPIAVNAATYVGSQQAGVFGAASATLGVVLPAFVIILLVSAVLKRWIKSRGVQNALTGIKPCVMGMILATGVSMACSVILTGGSGVSSEATGVIGNVSLSALAVLLLLIAVGFAYKKVRKAELSPIVTIIVSAVLGIMLY